MAWCVQFAKQGGTDVEHLRQAGTLSKKAIGCRVVGGELLLEVRGSGGIGYRRYVFAGHDQLQRARRDGSHTR